MRSRDSQAVSFVIVRCHSVVLLANCIMVHNMLCLYNRFLFLHARVLLGGVHLVQRRVEHLAMHGVGAPSTI